MCWGLADLVHVAVYIHFHMTIQALRLNSCTTDSKASLEVTADKNLRIRYLLS